MKRAGLCFIIMVMSLLSVFGQDDMPHLELPTDYVTEFRNERISLDRMVVVDGKLFFDESNNENRVCFSLDIITGKQRIYDPDNEFIVIYGQQDGEYVIVGRMNEKKDEMNIYLYDPEKDTYAGMGGLNSYKDDTFAFVERIFHFYGSKYIVVNGIDYGLHQNYVYDVATGAYERLPEISDKYMIIELSPDKMTAVLGRDGLFFLSVYSLFDQKLLTTEDQNKQGNGATFLNTTCFITEKSYSSNIFHLYDINMNRVAEVSYLEPENGSYSYYHQWRMGIPGTRFVFGKGRTSEDSAEFGYLILMGKGYTETLASLGLLFHPTTGTVNDNRIRVREWPLLDAKHLGFLNKGDELEILDRSGIQVTIDDMTDYWYKVRRTSDGLEGWSYGYFIDLADE